MTVVLMILSLHFFSQAVATECQKTFTMERKDWVTGKTAYVPDITDCPVGFTNATGQFNGYYALLCLFCIPWLGLLLGAATVGILWAIGLYVAATALGMFYFKTFCKRPILRSLPLFFLSVPGAVFQIAAFTSGLTLVAVSYAYYLILFAHVKL